MTIPAGTPSVTLFAANVRAHAIFSQPLLVSVARLLASMSNSILHVPVLADCKMRLDEADTAGTLITSRNGSTPRTEFGRIHDGIQCPFRGRFAIRNSLSLPA
jgi:hypothetical protein